MSISIENMLQNVAYIVEKNEEISVFKGEKFNLFKLLDRREDEVKTHSALIAELLNIKGSHYMGDIFLKKFLEHIQSKTKQITGCSIIHKFDFKNFNNINVCIEYDIGKKKGDFGGRIDILLSQGNQAICIENKVFAIDQELQLRRYYNFLKGYNKGLLIYLTPDGKSADFNSVATEKELHECNNSEDKNFEEKLKEDVDYLRLSYKEDILAWMEQCYSLATDRPILRESIKQYIILIKDLTNQLTSSEMKSEVHNQILSNLLGAETVANEFKNALQSVSSELREQVINLLKKEYLNAEINENNWRKFSGIFMKHPDIEDHIGIESFNGMGFENGSLYIGRINFEPQPDHTYKYRIWIEGSLIMIWNSKSEVFAKLQEYSNGNDAVKESIAKEVKDKIDNYIKSIKQ